MASAAPKPVLAYEKVRHAGEAVALVVAETAARAVDAAEAVVLDIEACLRCRVWRMR